MAEEYTDGNIAAALRAGEQLGEAKKNPQPEARPYVLVPNDHSIKYLESPEFPRRRAGTVKLSDVGSFLEYWKRQKYEASYIYGGMSPAQFVAVFNEHGSESSAQAGWRDHRALFTLEHSKEYREWFSRNRQPFDGNDKFLMWLEDNAIDIVRPTPAQMMDIAMNLRINQAQSFGKAMRLQDGNVEFSYVNEVTASVKLPETFEINIPVFSGLDSELYRFEARFRYRLKEGSVTIWYELIRPHKMVEQSFQDLLARIEAEATTKVLWGTPE